MQNEPSLITVEVARAFVRQVRTLFKKYRHIRSDIEPTLDLIGAGEFAATGYLEPSMLYSKYALEIATSRKESVPDIG